MFRWIALISIILTWPLISLGALVRLKGAGLACPDWPLCYGQLLPPPGFEIALEVGHRFVATILGICIIGLVALTFKPHYKKYRILALISLLLVCIQGALGGLTVLMRLSPPTVVLHLIGGNLLFGLLIYLTYRSFQDEKVAQHKNETIFPLSSFSKQQGMMLLLFFVILISGGTNSSTYSGYACPAFPGCQEGSPYSLYLGQIIEDGRFFPQFRNEWIHMIHRVIAIVGSVALVFLAMFTLSKKHGDIYRKVGIVLLGLLLLEILIGIANAIYHIPVPISLAHTTIAATIVGLLSFSFSKSIHEIQ